MSRRAIFAALTLAVLGSAACFAPRPCTQALCPSRVDGEYRIDGWNRSVTVAPGAALVPVVSDSQVTVLAGRVEFVNGETVVSAPAGSSFRYEVSTASARLSTISVSTGSVTVTASSAAVVVSPGAPYVLPRAH